jgi:hypothetical protein
MEEQTIFFNNYIYKIRKITNKYIYVNELKIEYELKHIKNQIYNYEEYICKYLRTLDIDDEIFVHFSDEINLNKKFKIAKNKFINYIIIENIDDVYLYNNKLMNDYHDWFKQSWDLQSKYSIEFYILLFTNQDIKNNLAEFRKNELLGFFFSYCGSYEKDIYYIKELGYYEIYLQLKEEADQHYFKDKELIQNAECPVCLQSNINVYKNFYQCTHNICYPCFSNWVDNDHKRNCPICRACI